MLTPLPTTARLFAIFFDFQSGALWRELCFAKCAHLCANSAQIFRRILRKFSRGIKGSHEAFRAILQPVLGERIFFRGAHILCMPQKHVFIFLF